LAPKLRIDGRGGPIDKINDALRNNPWRTSEQKEGRYVNASLGGANASETVKQMVLDYYREAGWDVEWVAGCRENGGMDHFCFKMPGSMSASLQNARQADVIARQHRSST
jgi:hypothetical protein